MLKIPFWKLQSIGNDFPLVHVENLPKGSDLAHLAIAICDRRYGVGGDGLLTLENGSPLKMRMFNPDGTEDFCGNGLRCAAVHGRAVGWVGSEFVIEHGGRQILTRIRDDGKVSTVLGLASYAPPGVPLKQGVGEVFQGPVYWDDERTVIGSALTTGSTHVIIPDDALPPDPEFLDLGARIEHFGLYPIRTSVIWRQELSPDHLRVRIWERGVGETLGCGTGASAAAADYLRGEGRGGRVRVDSAGGSVIVEMTAWDQPITVEGTAQPVYCGEFLYRGARTRARIRNQNWCGT